MNAAASSNQRTLPLIPLEPNLLPSKSKLDTYRYLVSIALKENLPLVAVELNKLERLSMFLQPVMNAKIALIAEQNKISFQQAFANLCAAGAEFLTNKQRQILGLSKEIKAPFNARKEQLKFYQGIMAGLNSNKIVLAEASTGVGKGRALCAAAIKAAEDGKKPVVITAPSLKVLGQLWKDMMILVTEDKIGCKLSYSFFPGASEFVDDEKLREYLNDNEIFNDQNVKDWVDAGGPLLNHNSPLRDAMSAMGIRPSFLMEDLKYLAQNMDVSDLYLSGDSECETAKVLKTIRGASRQSDIIFCTHTMLALSHLTSWALVPEPSVLIIDEAHLFEQNVAGVHSDALSMFSLSIRLRQSGKSTKAIKALNELSYTLQDNSFSSEKTVNLNNVDGALKAVIIEKVSKLLDAIKSKSYDDVERISNVRRVLNNTQRVLNGQSSDSSYLSFSPDFRYPSISTGKSDLKNILGSIWKSLQGGAILASATLYIKNQYGEDKCDYICDILAVPTSRTHIMEPIVADWVSAIPVLHIPSEAQAKSLMRPNIKSDDHSLNDSWLHNAAVCLNSISREAKGGTLLLATSYVQLATLKENLIALGTSEDRLVVQERNKKIEVFESIFKEKHRAGLRPIWLGLGGAWTGFNLSEEDKSIEDTVISDLVITCCPFGTNNSNAMNARIEAKKLSPIKNESLMMLKQGIGRLVRSPDHKDKHIWFLDGRIYTEWEGMQDFQKSVKVLLSRYKKREYFSFD